MKRNKDKIQEYLKKAYGKIKKKYVENVKELVTFKNILDQNKLFI